MYVRKEGEETLDIGMKGWGGRRMDIMVMYVIEI